MGFQGPQSLLSDWGGGTSYLGGIALEGGCAFFTWGGMKKKLAGSIHSLGSFVVRHFCWFITISQTLLYHGLEHSAWDYRGVFQTLGMRASAAPWKGAPSQVV